MSRTTKVIGHERKGRRVRTHTRHLYSTAKGRRESEREFRERYGSRGGRDRKGYRYIYGATVGKVRREQAAKGTRSHREIVRAHRAHSRKGRRYRVRRSVRYI